MSFRQIMGSVTWREMGCLSQDNGDGILTCEENGACVNTHKVAYGYLKVMKARGQSQHRTIDR